jgi:hypothetical protein
MNPSPDTSGQPVAGRSRRLGGLTRITATAGLALLMAGAGSTAAFAAGARGTTAAARSGAAAAPCTKAALKAAKPSGGTDIKQFGCAGGWAYAFVIVQPQGGPGVEETSVYRSSDGTWGAVNRTVPCEKHEVPKAIYRDACETN